jgi:hypothetical protein
MPIPDAPIVGLGVGQAESGLVQKEKRWLLGLETTGLERLAAVIRALAVRARLRRKNAALAAATGQQEFPAQDSGLGPACRMRGARQAISHRRNSESVGRSLRKRGAKEARVRPKQLCSLVMVFN